MSSTLLGFGDEFLIAPAAVSEKASEHLFRLYGSAGLHVATVFNPLAVLAAAQSIELL